MTMTMTKHPGGRPPRFKTESDLAAKVDEYFQTATKNKRMFSKAGLLVTLDIDKSTYSDYKKKFPHPIKYAEALIEECWVNRLSETGATGAIFYLKNAFRDDYKDRSETDITSGGKSVVPILGGLSRKDEAR